jgi:protein-disulfide isomerase
MKEMVCHAVVVGLISAVCAIVPAGLRAQASGGSYDADIQELKKGQAEIKQELKEIRKILTPEPVTVAEALEAVVAVGDIATQGSKNAPLTMIEFSDYQCPYCKRHVEQTVPALVKDYVATGKMRYAFRDFPLAAIHPLAAKAAEAARCAGDQGKYWEMHDRMFARQDELQTEKLPAHAEAIGIDAAKFRACLDQGRHAAAVQKDVAEGTKIGVRGTPSIVIGTSDGASVKNAVIIRGAHAVETFKAEIDRLMAVPAPEKK